MASNRRSPSTETALRPTETWDREISVCVRLRGGAERTRTFAPQPPPLTPPILLGLALHGGRALRVFYLHPMCRAPGAVRRAKPLRHDAFATEFEHIAWLKRPGYALRLPTRRASAGGIDAEALGVCAMRKARRRCMFLITAARRSASCFIASAISASRRSTRDAVLSFGSLFSGSGCFASSMIGRPCTQYNI
jgi:hypothetical protein